MRVLQIIDSLEPGGAEMIAVNYANALAKRIEFSALATTRSEGDLKLHILPETGYLFLNRKVTLDLPAVFLLRKFCRKHEIHILQAHSSSFLIAFLVKITLPRLKIIWHDHDGMSEFLHERQSFALQATSFLFHGIISVNSDLKKWAEKKLHCRNVIYLPNFTQPVYSGQDSTSLNGNSGMRILCLANLRAQKNHFLLIDVARKLKESHPDWSFHFVGKDFKDDYSEALKDAVSQYGLQQQVFLYGSRNDVSHIIPQSDIAVLGSRSEGLPVSLLEYGFHKLPVVVTRVGEIPSIIRDHENGISVPSEDPEAFYSALLELIGNSGMRTNLGCALFKDISSDYSENAVMIKYINWIQNKQDAI